MAFPRTLTFSNTTVSPGVVSSSISGSMVYGSFPTVHVPREERATLVRGQWTFLPKVERVSGPLFFRDLTRKVLISEVSAVKLFQDEAQWRPMLDASQLSFDGDMVGFIQIGDLRADAYLWRPIRELSSGTRQG